MVVAVVVVAPVVFLMVWVVVVVVVVVFVGTVSVIVGVVDLAFGALLGGSYRHQSGVWWVEGVGASGNPTGNTYSGNDWVMLRQNP